MSFPYDYSQPQGSGSPNGASATGTAPNQQAAQQPPSASPIPYPNNPATGSQNSGAPNDGKTTLWWAMVQ